jgi:hypothetical protein
MCGRITLTRPNLESIASELNIAPENYRGYPISLDEVERNQPPFYSAKVQWLRDDDG